MKQIKLMKKSFNKKILPVLLFDILCVSVFLLIVMLWSNLSQGLIIDSGIESMDLTQTELMEQYANQMQTLALGLISYFVLLFVLVLASYSFFQGKIWNLILDKKMTKKYFWKFTLLNLIWFVGWIAIFFAALTLVGKASTALIVLIYLLLFIAVYLSVILYIKFTQKNLILKSIKETFLSLKKINKFIKPILITLGIFILLNIILLIFKLLPYNIFMTITGLATLGYVAWARIYLTEIIKDIK